MSHEILKYTIEPEGVTPITLPVGSRVCFVGHQLNKVRIWVDIDKSAPDNETRYFSIVGTGWDFENSRTYVGTTQIEQYVWHVLEAA